MKYTLTLQEGHFHQLKELLLKEDGFERPAILLCGRAHAANDMWDGGSELRFLSREVIPVRDSEIEHHDNLSLRWNTERFRHAMKKAANENLAICLVHSHPRGASSFSAIDDENEKELFSILHKRNASQDPNLSLVLTRDELVFGRAWTVGLRHHDLSLIRIFGKRFQFFYKSKFENFSREEFSRQQLAFGKTLGNDLSKLRVGVVGCGATGSATAHLLARLGVGQILLIDNDLVERSNLSRLYGANTSDADGGNPKTDVLKTFIAGIGIGCRVRSINNWVGSEECRSAIKSCDVIFGCTDDNAGRIFLNRLAHFYLIPLIDMGIAIDLDESEQKGIEDLKGRVTIVMPGQTCLMCRELVDGKLAYEENLKRSDPTGFERQKEEAYVTGGGNPSPAVITFTTEVATMAVNEFIHRITGFKKGDTGFTHVIRFFDKGIDRKQSARLMDGCRICSETNYWGKGDVEPFMDQSN